ncbi:MAG: MBL fold metallo-hydrolase [Verrucomicrobiota bacterium]
MTHFFRNLTCANEIGANSYYLEVGGTKLVLDSGMHPKREARESLPHHQTIRDEVLDAILVTHSHLDHVGSLPVLMRQHPAAEVHMTEPCRALAEAMLHNSVNVMMSKREELDITEYPFFSHGELDDLFPGIRGHGLEKAFYLDRSEVVVSFHDAGHILGAAGVLLEHGGKRLFYTGDVNFDSQTILQGANFPQEPVDVLIMETTRGDAPRPPGFSRAREIERLADCIEATFDRAGGVLIPVFAIGKTQELLLTLNQLKIDGKIRNAPIHIGGLSTKMTTIYDKFAHRWPRHYPGFRILDQMSVTVASRKRRKAIRYSPGSLYALSSGMMTENTVSNGFARHFLPNSRNGLFFVGYADPDSPAGKILAAQPGEQIELDPRQRTVPLECQVERFDFSGHADREALRAYANQLQPKKIFLVHGDRQASEWFQQTLSADMPACEVLLPEPGQDIPLW